MRRVLDAMSLQLEMPVAFWRHVLGSTTCDPTSVSLVINETRMWVMCKFTNEVESDTTDDDAFGCLDSWDYFYGIFIWSRCRSRLECQLVLRSRLLQDAQSLGGTRIHLSPVRFGSWIAFITDGSGG